MVRPNIQQNSQQQGFTLIELSIVLVIIGLIVGGILVGQDLIKAAEIRATVSQIEKYNTSVNTFRNKYGYIPGDIPAAMATRLGFFAETTAGVGHGDGNNLLEGCAAGVDEAVCEILSFWRHLTDAQMIDGNFGTTAAGNALDASNGQAAADANAAGLKNLIPPARIGRGNYLIVYGSTGFNYFQLTGVTSITAVGGAYNLAASLTPIEANNIDSKTDDGLPLVGNVRAMFDTGAAADPNTLSVAGASNCTFTNNLYNISTTNGNTPLCQLRLRFN